MMIESLPLPPSTPWSKPKLSTLAQGRAAAGGIFMAHTEKMFYYTTTNLYPCMATTHGDQVRGSLVPSG